MSDYRMLVVDDEEPIRTIFTRIGQSMNWDVSSVDDGNKAIELLQNEEFQIYLVDVKMPGPSGVELAQKILALNKSSAIIIISGYEKFKDEDELRKLGIFRYIQKGALSLPEIKANLLEAAQYHESMH